MTKHSPREVCMLIRIPKTWELPEALATPESVYLDRRSLLRAGGVVAGGVALAAAGAPPRATGGGEDSKTSGDPEPSGTNAALYPAKRNPSYSLDRPLTEESLAARFNVFDEMSVDHQEVWKLAGSLVTDPWTIHVGGLVERPLKLDLDSLVRTLGLEERLYRHRCVEAWAMAVPWTGIPLKRFIEHVKPIDKARYLRMVSVARPEQSPGWYATRRVFPYYEALSMAEATNELAFLATGIYGHALPPQHGAPIRLVVPWKWGLKSIKSIVAFEFLRERPGTLWNDLSPDYYTFECNVDPVDFPGPWSQAEETHARHR